MHSIIVWRLNSVSRLQEFLALSAARHSHLCPRQVLGVRIGMAASDLFDLDLPQKDKRLFAFVETDGCFVDGISIATGCSLGHRTLRLVDYGKVAVTLADTLTGEAYRIAPLHGVRDRAINYAPGADSPWHAQVYGYQLMPVEELLHIEAVELSVTLSEIISRPGIRVNCARCDEEVMNARHVTLGGVPVCLACASKDRYYRNVCVSDSDLNKSD